jgi:hypothetical protein
MAVPLKQHLRTYHVYDPTVGNELAGVVVVQKDENIRVVQLSDVQAKYFVDQGVIGLKPLNQLSAEGREVMHQMSGGHIPKAGGKQQVKSGQPEEPLGDTKFKQPPRRG